MMLLWALFQALFLPVVFVVWVVWHVGSTGTKPPNLEVLIVALVALELALWAGPGPFDE